MKMSLWTNPADENTYENTCSYGRAAFAIAGGDHCIRVMPLLRAMLILICAPRISSHDCGVVQGLALKYCLVI